MAQQPGLAFSSDCLARGRDLAERRLAHLTELYDTGRWIRYFSDHDFLANACAARQAVEIWYRLEQPTSCDLAVSPSIAPDIAVNLVPSESEDDTAGDQDWHHDQNYWLPPVSFSADSVGTERDLREV